MPRQIIATEKAGRTRSPLSQAVYGYGANYFHQQIYRGDRSATA